MGKINILKGRMFGHPIHVMLVHFPAAFLPFSFIADIAGIVFNDTLFFQTGFYLAAAGAAAGILAAAFGFIDLLNLEPGSKAQKIALLHGSLGTIWILIFAVIIGIQVKEFPVIENPGNTVIALKGICTAGLMFSNYLGGELVLKYKVGVKQ